MQTYVKYKENSYQLALLEQCGISAVINNTHQFYGLPFLECLASHLLAGDWTVDVGAHIGNQALFLAKELGVNSLVIEPNPQAFGAIKQQIKLNRIDNQIIPVNRAISHEDGDVGFSQTRKGDASSFVITETPVRGGFRCKTATLDSYGDFFKGKNLKLIKVAVEGAEESVLKTGRALIEAFKPLVATDVGSVERFREQVAFFHGFDYVPISIHNDRPVVLWQYQNGARAREVLLKIFDYGIAQSSFARQLSDDAHSLKTQYIALKENHSILKEEDRLKASLLSAKNTDR